MAAHCSVLAWRTPGMEEPGGLLWSRTELDMTEATQQQQNCCLVLCSAGSGVSWPYCFMASACPPPWRVFSVSSYATK